MRLLFSGSESSLVANGLWDTARRLDLGLVTAVGVLVGCLIDELFCHARPISVKKQPLVDCPQNLWITLWSTCCGSGSGSIKTFEIEFWSHFKQATKFNEFNALRYVSEIRAENACQTLGGHGIFS